MTEHGRQFPDRALRSHFVANRLLLGRRDRLVGVGEHVRVALIANEGFPSARVRVLRNGIDIAAFARVKECRPVVRRELGIAAGDFVILQAARLQAIKDHATAIRAMARVVASQSDVRLLIAGEGPEASEIDSLIKRMNLGAHVRRLGLRTDIDRLLGAADAALLSSLSEGIPLALIEAMAASLPVVSTGVGGVPEVVEEGESGLLVGAGDDEAMAERILRLARNPALGQQLGQAGRERAEALFSEERMIAEYARMYREMTDKKAGDRERDYRPWSEPACPGA
jgi:glycosyltransferase involved in cell wall biosynthesis